MKNKPKNILCIHNNYDRYQYYGGITPESAWTNSIMCSFSMVMINFIIMVILIILFNIGSRFFHDRILKIPCDDGTSINDLAHFHKNYTQTQHVSFLLICNIKDFYQIFGNFISGAKFVN